MNDQDLEPMSTDIQKLLASEASRATLSAAALARVTQRVDESLAWAAASGAAAGPSPSPSAAAPAAKLAAAKLVSVFVAGAVLGGAIDHLVWPSVVTEPPAPVAVEPEPQKQLEAPLAPAPEPSPPPSPEPKRAPPRLPAKPPSAPERDRLLARERALLELARTALSRGKIEDAKRALEEHQSAFPAGTLAEEREVLAIQALWLEGKPDQARDRAARFRARYPKSVLSPGLEPELSP